MGIPFPKKVKKSRDPFAAKKRRDKKTKAKRVARAQKLVNRHGR